MAGTGALLFGSGNLTAAYVGRFLQGAGGVFALIGAVYIISKNFPASRAATLVGATQMFGSSGGSAGQFLVGPMIAGGLAWEPLLDRAGHRRASRMAVTLVLAASQGRRRPNAATTGLKAPLTALATVFKNPQSILCGLLAGLFFIPTTIFDMIWGVRFLQEGHGFDYGEAVIRSATVPLGWIIGSPLWAFISDRIGRRKPVIVGGGCVLLACLFWILYGPKDVLPPYVLGLIAGIASGAAMVTYTVVKEANPPQFGGTATGVIGFLNFTFSALMGPVFGSRLQRFAGDIETGPRAIPNDFSAPFIRSRPGCRADRFPAEGNRTGGAHPRGDSGGSMKSDSKTGTGKYERILERCAGLAPVPTAVAHPCDKSSLAGALEASEIGLIKPILVGPGDLIAEVAAAVRHQPRRHRNR